MEVVLDGFPEALARPGEGPVLQRHVVGEPAQLAVQLAEDVTENVREVHHLGGRNPAERTAVCLGQYTDFKREARGEKRERGEIAVLCNQPLTTSQFVLQHIAVKTALLIAVIVTGRQESGSRRCIRKKTTRAASATSRSSSHTHLAPKRLRSRVARLKRSASNFPAAIVLAYHISAPGWKAQELPWTIRLLNLLILLCVVFIPFPASLLGQNPFAKVSLQIYALTLSLTNAAGVAFGCTQHLMPT